MTIAPRAPVRAVPSTDGVTVAVHDLGGDGPPVLLCHPTGFLAMTWSPLAAALGGRAHSVALDFRGHGDSPPPVPPDQSWTGMAEDVLATVDALGLTGVRAAGHSMGGAALLMAEQRRPGTFARLWLYEPIVFPTGRVPGTGSNPLAAAAARRRPRFADRAAALANFASKPPLDVLHPDALRAYVDHGLRDDGDSGGVVLKCPPEIEAATFEGSIGHATFDRLGEVRCAVTVAAGGEPAGPAQLAPLIAGALPAGTLERHPELTHFGPMEAPEAMADSVAAALGLT